jgi:large subunit ribosomal protein L15
MRAGFEGGQMPIYMRIGKLRGSTSKDAYPVGPFRTFTHPVNVRDLDRFEAGDEVTPESLVEKGILKNTKIDVKLLGTGEISKKLVVRLHAISATAREKIEAAGGTVELLREPKERKQRKHVKPAETPEPEEQAAAEAGDETPVDEAAAEAPEE